MLKQEVNMASSKKSPLKDTKQAAKFLRLEPRTLNNMRWKGEGPNYHKHGSRVFYHIKDLKAWSDSHYYGMTANH